MSGADFDQTYLKYQIKMHEQAIDLVQHTADSVHNRRLHHYLKGPVRIYWTHVSTASAMERYVVARY